jgi:hypothetical protein
LPLCYLHTLISKVIELLTIEKVQKKKQRSTKHTYQAKGRVTRVTLKIEVNAGALEGSVDPAALVTPVVLI